uniref:Putative secreted protein n=1 Tax=Ixodes ricinus TaxID=34613 RepID=A0A6B0U2X8_IXORI
MNFLALLMSSRIINSVLTYVTRCRCCCTVIEACPPWEYLPLYILLPSRPRAGAATAQKRLCFVIPDGGWF